MLSLALLLALSPPAAPVTARVVGIVDGDTITVLIERTQVRIRLNGIDCPEKGQPFGRAATELTSSLAFGKTVQVISHGPDRYGRTVADIILPGGKSLNQELVRAGLAWWFRRYAPRDKTLARLEEEARDARRGLWRDEDPIPPWLWRKKGKLK